MDFLTITVASFSFAVIIFISNTRKNILAEIKEVKELNLQIRHYQFIQDEYIMNNHLAIFNSVNKIDTDLNYYAIPVMSVLPDDMPYVVSEVRINKLGEKETVKLKYDKSYFNAHKKKT